MEVALGLADRDQGPLKGFKVLDLTRLVPGALATRKLADLGAEVVKVEEPGRGDYQRWIPPIIDGQGLLHRVLDRGKKSVTIDYRTPEGQKLLYQLALSADAVVEVSRPGRLSSFGVELGAMRERKPDLVVCSITSFGQSGPLALLPSHGMSIDSLAGWVTIEADTDGSLNIAAAHWTSIAVELGALNAALGVVAALHESQRTGQGAWIDVSCWDCATEALRYRLVAKQATGTDWINPRRMGPTYAVYATADGSPFLFCCTEAKFYYEFCDRVGRPELKAHRDGALEAELGDNAELASALEEVFRRRTAAEWTELFTEWQLPGGNVVDALDVSETKHFQARRLLGDKAEDDAIVPVLDPLLWMDSEWRPGTAAAPSPKLGADTADVLERWLEAPGPP